MNDWKDDIEKYRAGKLTPAERHALEKKALSDPFLADALEGVEEISADEFLSDVNELNQKILGQGRNRWLWPLRIAASIIGIGIIGSLIFYNRVNEKENLASNQQKQTESNEGPKADSVNQTGQLSGETTDSTINETAKKPTPKQAEGKKADETLVAALKENKPNAAKPSTETSIVSSSGAGGTYHTITPDRSKEKSNVVLDSVVNGFVNTTLSSSFTLSEERDIVEESPTTPPSPKVALNEDSKISRARPRVASVPNLKVSGIVRDQQGRPIPGVNIVAKGTTTGAVTDTDGKYTIEVPSSDQTLVYSFIGFEAQEQSLKKVSDGTLDVKLEEDVAQLSEVVVTGYGEKRENSEPVVRLAEPEGGRKAYDQYLEEKKIYPQQALENKIEGKVTIEFTVGVTGNLSDFQVLKTVGYGCDEELIRLVKEGPQWKPSYIDNEAVESLVRIKTKFKLPGK